MVVSAVREQVQDYYGRVLKAAKDLKTGACCASATMPGHIKAIIREIDDEITTQFYGCGSPIPQAIEGCTVLDLGCGTGRDAFLCAKLVGPNGRVIGVDMTPEQLDVARRHEASQAQRFGLSAPNTTFLQGYIEELDSLSIEQESVDVVISNCVINLSPRKDLVFENALRLLKPGGELFFSDIFADRRLPPSLRDDQELLGECLAGAMYFEDFRRLMSRLGLSDIRVVDQSAVTLDDPVIQRKIGFARFQSMTVRVLKLPGLEDRCEDYGQVAVYSGTMEYAPHAFMLDDHHVFEKGRPVPVCGNTAMMLEKSRFAPYFRVDGDRNTHYGLFPCAADPASRDAGEGRGRSACC